MLQSLLNGEVSDKASKGQSLGRLVRKLQAPGTDRGGAQGAQQALAAMAKLPPGEPAASSIATTNGIPLPSGVSSKPGRSIRGTLPSRDVFALAAEAALPMQNAATNFGAAATAMPKMRNVLQALVPEPPAAGRSRSQEPPGHSAWSKMAAGSRGPLSARDKFLSSTSAFGDQSVGRIMGPPSENVSSRPSSKEQAKDQEQVDELVDKEEEQGIGMLAKKLVGHFGSLTKAFETFAYNKKGEVTRSQWDSAVSTYNLDIDKLAGLQHRQLFRLIDTRKKKAKGAMTLEDWLGFFGDKLTGTPDEGLLTEDKGDDCTLRKQRPSVQAQLGPQGLQQLSAMAQKQARNAKAAPPPKAKPQDSFTGAAELAQRLVDQFSSLDKAFSAFGRMDKVTRTQWDASLNAYCLDVEKFCGVGGHHLFRMIDALDGVRHYVITREDWHDFFIHHLKGTPHEGLISRDTSEQIEETADRKSSKRRLQWKRGMSIVLEHDRDDPGSGSSDEEAGDKQSEKGTVQTGRPSESPRQDGGEPSSRTSTKDKIPDGFRMRDFAMALIDEFGSIDKAYGSFDDNFSDHITWTQWDATLGLHGLDTDQLCGVSSGKLFKMMDSVTGDPDGVINTDDWKGFFELHLQGEDASLLTKDIGDECRTAKTRRQVRASSLLRRSQFWKSQARASTKEKLQAQDSIGGDGGHGGSEAADMENVHSAPVVDEQLEKSRHDQTLQGQENQLGQESHVGQADQQGQGDVLDRKKGRSMNSDFADDVLEGGAMNLDFAGDPAFAEKVRRLLQALPKEGRPRDLESLIERIGLGSLTPNQVEIVRQVAEELGFFGGGASHEAAAGTGHGSGGVAASTAARTGHDSGGVAASTAPAGQQGTTSRAGRKPGEKLMQDEDRNNYSWKPDDEIKRGGKSGQEKHSEENMQDTSGVLKTALTAVKDKVNQGTSGDDFEAADDDGDDDDDDDELEEEDLSTEKSVIVRTFRSFATGRWKDQPLFRRQDLREFADALHEVFPKKALKRFKRFHHYLMSWFEDVLTLAESLALPGVRRPPGLTLSWFHVFVQKALGGLGFGIVELFLHLF